MEMYVMLIALGGVFPVIGVVMLVVQLVKKPRPNLAALRLYYSLTGLAVWLLVLLVVLLGAHQEYGALSLTILAIGMILIATALQIRFARSGPPR